MQSPHGITVLLPPYQDVLHLLQDELRIISWLKDFPFVSVDILA